MTPYAKGYAAFLNGLPLHSNPFPFVDSDGETDHRQFCAGWYDAQDDSK